MDSGHAVRCHRSPVLYRIVIRGEASEPLVGPLETMTVARSGADTVLTGRIIDQAQLQGALQFLGQLGVEIVSVNTLDDVSTLPGQDPRRGGARDAGVRPAGAV